MIERLLSKQQRSMLAACVYMGGKKDCKRIWWDAGRVTTSIVVLLGSDFAVH